MPASRAPSLHSKSASTAQCADDDADTRAILRAAQGHDAGASDLDTPALSSYEKKVALSQIAGDVAADFDTGVGRDARAYLNFLAGGTAVLATGPGDEASATIRVSAPPRARPRPQASISSRRPNSTWPSPSTPPAARTRRPMPARPCASSPASAPPVNVDRHGTSPRR